VIRVVRGALADQDVDGLLRPIRSDLDPVTAAARDVGQRAGERVAERLAASGALPVGGAELTPGGGLAARLVVHVVVMPPEEPQTPSSIDRALRNGLARAADWELDSLALPLLGLGAGRMDPEETARAFLDVLEEHLAAGRPPLDLCVVASNEYERDLLDRMLGAL